MTAPKSILLDNDFLDDPKIQLAIDEFGLVVIARYLRLITGLNRAGGRMLKAHVFALGRALGDTKDVWREFLTFCVREELISEDEDSFFKKRLIDDAENIRTKREVWRDKKRILRGVSGDKDETPGGVSNLSEPEPEVLIKKNGAPEKVPVDPGGLIVMTPNEAEKLITKYGPECFDCLIADAVSFAKQKPKKWATYKDHYSFVDNSYKRKREGGRGFFKHPRDGPGFYPQWEIDKLQPVKASGQT
jgi:hypothetical protein